jgi:hypothetical protein
VVEVVGVVDVVVKETKSSSARQPRQELARVFAAQLVGNEKLEGRVGRESWREGEVGASRVLSRWRAGDLRHEVHRRPMLFHLHGAFALLFFKVSVWRVSK